MGGKSSSRSSTTNENYNIDERVAASDNAVLINTNIDGNNNTVTDLGAISKAFDFAEKNNSDAFDFANNVADESFAFSKQSTSEAMEALNQNTRLAFDFANNATISADERVVNKLLPILIAGAVIIAVVYLFKTGGRKK